MDLGAHLLPDRTLLDAQETTISDDPALITLTVVSRQPTSPCPCCATPASRIHSRYCRRLTDLPWAGYRSRLILHVRRFFCANPPCPRKIFTERLPTVLAPWARRTHRLAKAQQQIGVALGGAAGVRLAAALSVGGGVDLLLHAIRTAPLPATPAPQQIGVDDWAWRKGATYGTIIVDHETHRPVDLLPDRRAETLATWLTAHPSVTLITRDRSGAFAEGAASGAPTAIQVADRFHLLMNIREAVFQSLSPYRAAIEALFTDPVVLDSMPPMPTPAETAVTGCPVIALATALPPQPIAAAKAAQTSAVQDRRQEQAAIVHDLHGRGWTQTAIAAHLRRDRQTVARYLQHPLGPPPQRHPPRRSILDPYKPYML
jgi:transposase